MDIKSFYLGQVHGKTNDFSRWMKVGSCLWSLLLIQNIVQPGLWYCLSMYIKRAYKYRFYPNPAQEVILARTFGCARFAYNYMLRLRTDAWYQEQKRISYNDTSSELTKLKREPEYVWLSEVSSVPVQQSLRHLRPPSPTSFPREQDIRPTTQGGERNQRHT